MATMRKLVLLTALLGLSHTASAEPVKPGGLGGLVRSIFKGAAQEKQARVFHSRGVGYKATFTAPDGTTHPAFVRVSRAGTSPSNTTKPAIEGLAVKVGGQDFLMIASKSDKGLGGRILKTAGKFGGETFSSITTYGTQGMKGVVSTELPAGMHTPIDIAPRTPADADQSFELKLQQTLWGRTGTRDIGKVTVHLDQRLDQKANDQLRFSPYNDAGGVKPAGLVNLIRKFAMAGSQAGRLGEK